MKKDHELNVNEINNYIKIYRDALLLDNLPFWIKHSVDYKFGGFLFSLDRDGSIVNPDKSMWTHGRFVWLLSTLYTSVEHNSKWLELAKHGIDFIRKYGFDSDGRLICPGHAIETSWFIMNEVKKRNGDERLKNIGLTILDWSWEWGWDKEYGGITYYRDAKNFPCQEYWHDMKFWWPQCEAIIASLMAYQLSGNSKYLQWHKMIHTWTFSLFPDKEYGEWYGYFHRDGRLSNTLKGNMWKGPFHIPRMLLYSWKILEEMKNNYTDQLIL